MTLLVFKWRILVYYILLSDSGVFKFELRDLWKTSRFPPIDERG